jgi:plastocyanin
MRTLVAALLAALVVPAGAGAATYEVAIPGNFFAPSQLVVLLGDTVTWTNDDMSTHTVTASGVFDSGALAHGDSFSWTFAAQGSYRYLCTIHRFMQGEVGVYGLVLDGPQDAITPGQTVTLAGRAPAGTDEVEIERQLSDGSHLPVATVHADAGGSFSFAVSPNLPTYYRAVVGDWVSPDVLVSVSALVRLRVTGTRGRAVLLEATTAPDQVGARVVLERYVRERFAWQRVKGATLGAQSRARFRYEPKQPVRVRVRLVDGVDGYGPAVSNERRIWPPRR